MSARAAEGRAAPRVISNPEALLIKALEPSIVERIDLPRRNERRAVPPKAFLESPACLEFLSSLGSLEAVWLHQSKALHHVDAGRDVLITTGTGSGKSLVFQLPLLRALEQGEGTAIVFYPQKALCSDQLLRWRKMLTATGLPETLVGEISGDTPMPQPEKLNFSSGWYRGQCKTIEAAVFALSGGKLSSDGSEPQQ